MNRIVDTIRPYHPLVWVVVGGTVFARTAYFMSMPFLALYLSGTSGLDPFLTGNGLCRSFFEPISQALLADVTPSEKRMRVFGFRYMAINVGAPSAP